MTDDARAFDRLAAAWQRDTAHLSNTNQAVRLPTGQALVALGVAAVPHIFARLARRPDPCWLTLLWTILGDGPDIPEQDRGYVVRVTEHWLAWGRARGYLPARPDSGEEE